MHTTAERITAALRCHTYRSKYLTEALHRDTAAERPTAAAQGNAEPQRCNADVLNHDGHLTTFTAAAASHKTAARAFPPYKNEKFESPEPNSASEARSLSAA